MQARLSAAFGGAPPSSAAGGAAAAVLAASLSAFSAFSASRTSLVAAPRSGCCSRSLASSGLKPRSGSATRRPRTASRRASGVQALHMRRAKGRRATERAVARPRQSTRAWRAPSLARGGHPTSRASNSARVTSLFFVKFGRENKRATFSAAQHRSDVTQQRISPHSAHSPTQR
eukprot:scaffold76205_cov59-Phaeocystis_antarctica.AAC.6